MRTLVRFVHLPLAEQSFVLKIGFLLAMIRLGLWLIPFRVVRHMLIANKPMNAQAWDSTPPSAEQIAWTVERVSNYIPAATCLTQALATQYIFNHYGIPADLRIGVAKSLEGKVEAHAWVESEGQIILGQLDDLSRFVPLHDSTGKFYG